MFDNEPSMDNCSDVNKSLLASPIISLGPHGLEFNSNRLPVSYFNTLTLLNPYCNVKKFIIFNIFFQVLISLPIPNYHEIIRVCPNAKLIAYESSTDDGEPMVWKKIDVELSPLNFIGYRHGISGSLIPVVTFPVYHFSFFKVKGFKKVVI